MWVEQRVWSRDSGWRPVVEAASPGESAQFVLLFGGVTDVRDSRALELVKASYPRAHVIGCTTAGQIQDGHVTDETVTFTAVGFEHTRVELVRAPIMGI